ncbi:hypothetical protein, conserved [Trypanosoma brucei gambiense DAL972]|uniref:Uncharacterized protein n=2 Tax=Trypanosoma brucei TaxID=5691 RepID=C9ZLK1_TRYB9|nr:hypothetical protein, conserved [Trypanosoma brucei gambiense DAL972]RHW73502.1 hypothetical protein DPX39_030049100 [Trypanosoma brucei equiperdum]CBH10210.1 hypothetical protein, conserved [Trypanosoma brucei gambiense DAL972]|eukprot:XP_011772500.1 hypothetical protein, conserved [Trypanosoma brucei gambiense DAL972]
MRETAIMNNRLVLLASASTDAENGSVHVRGGTRCCGPCCHSDQKRGRSVWTKPTLEADDTADSDACEDVVKRSERLLELLRVRKIQCDSAVDTSSMIYDVEAEMSPLAASGTRMCGAIFSQSSALVPLSSIAGDKDLVEFDVSGEEKTNLVPVSSRSLLKVAITCTDAETQTLPAPVGYRVESPIMTKPDWFVLRLCELDALLHIFFS